MFSVLECVVYQHDLRFVLIAALVCILGNISLFVILSRSTHCVDTRRRHWLLVAAVAEGGSPARGPASPAARRS